MESEANGAKIAEEQTTSGSLAALSHEIRDARAVLDGLEARALADVAETLAQAANSLAQTAERLEALNPDELMDADECAVFLRKTRKALDHLLATTNLPRHYVTERGILFSRREVYEWVLGRPEFPRI
jgi:hypothetical protein